MGYGNTFQDSLYLNSDPSFHSPQGVTVTDLAAFRNPRKDDKFIKCRPVLQSDIPHYHHAELFHIITHHDI